MSSLDVLKQERKIIEQLIESWGFDISYKKSKIEKAKEDLEELNETIRIMEK